MILPTNRIERQVFSRPRVITQWNATATGTITPARNATDTETITPARNATDTETITRAWNATDTETITAAWTAVATPDDCGAARHR
jgi:hypothetical protein